MAINRETKITVKVNNNNGILNPTALTVKNQFREYQLNSIQDLPDVDEIEVTNGATIVYNTATSKYEVKQIDIDGGEY